MFGRATPRHAPTFHATPRHAEPSHRDEVECASSWLQLLELLQLLQPLQHAHVTERYAAGNAGQRVRMLNHPLISHSSSAWPRAG